MSTQANEEALPSTSSSSSAAALTSRDVSPFAGRNFVVTGCTTFVGNAICQLLAKEGASLALATHDKAEGQELCRDLQRLGHTGSLLLSVMEPTDADRLSNFIRSATKTLKRLDGLINCAVHSGEEDMLHQTKSSIAATIMNANYDLTQRAMQTAISLFETQNDNKLLHPQGGYPIVNVVSSWDAQEYCSIYEAARHAIIGLSRSAACEYATSDIRVNVVLAGLVDGQEQVQSLINQIFTSINEVKSRIPMRRSARPEEVAQAVLYLLGPSSSYVTGVVLPVDGGIGARRG